MFDLCCSINDIYSDNNLLIISNDIFKEYETSFKEDLTKNTDILLIDVTSYENTINDLKKGLMNKHYNNIGIIAHGNDNKEEQTYKIFNITLSTSSNLINDDLGCKYLLNIFSILREHTLKGLHWFSCNFGRSVGLKLFLLNVDKKLKFPEGISISTNATGNSHVKEVYYEENFDFIKKMSVEEYQIWFNKLKVINKDWILEWNTVSNYMVNTRPENSPIFLYLQTTNNLADIILLDLINSIKTAGQKLISSVVMVANSGINLVTSTIEQIKSCINNIKNIFELTSNINLKDFIDALKKYKITVTEFFTNDITNIFNVILENIKSIFQNLINITIENILNIISLLIYFYDQSTLTLGFDYFQALLFYLTSLTQSKKLSNTLESKYCINMDSMTGDIESYLYKVTPKLINSVYMYNNAFSTLSNVENIFKGSGTGIGVNYSIINYGYYENNKLLHIVLIDKNTKICYVVFRGTSTLADVLVDATCTSNKVSKYKNVTIHDGVEKYYGNIKHFNPTNKNLVELLNALTDCSRIVFTGHSLGGGLAALACYDYLLNKTKTIPVNLVTFASMKIGKGDFCLALRNLLNSNINSWFSYRVYEDIVPVTSIETFIKEIDKPIDYDNISNSRIPRPLKKFQFMGLPENNMIIRDKYVKRGESTIYSCKLDVFSTDFKNALGNIIINHSIDNFMEGTKTYIQLTNYV